MMYGRGKSDFAIVAVKPANKADHSAEQSAVEATAAEPVERRAETKGNASQQSMCRTQSRASVSQALERIRQTFAVMTRGRSRMRESCMYGSARGAPSNGRPYRDRRTTSSLPGTRVFDALLPAHDHLTTHAAFLKRREFIMLIGGAAVAWPLSAPAPQPAKIPRIGRIDESPIWSAFRNGLRDLGYVDGQNIAFEYRYAGGMPDRLAWVAVGLVRRPVDLIATFGTAPTLAAKQATTTIPIVMMGVGDPVGGRARTEPRPARRQYHGEHHPRRGGRRQTGAAAQGGSSLPLARGLPLESGQCFPSCPTRRGARGGSHVGDKAAPPRGAQSRRIRRRLRDHGQGAPRRVLDDQRSVPPAQHRADHRFSRQQSAAGNVRYQRGCGCRRRPVLRRELARPVPARRCVRA